MTPYFIFFLFKVKSVRESYTKIISDKHEDSIAKFGAILAQGIIDAGMCNNFFTLHLRNTSFKIMTGPKHIG